MAAFSLFSPAIFILTFIGSAAQHGAAGKNAHLVKPGADYIRGYVYGIAFYCSGRVLNGFMNITDILKKGSAQVSSRIVKTIAGIEISHVLTLYASSAALAAYGVHVQLRNSVGIFHLGVADTVWTMAMKIAIPVGLCLSAVLILFRENLAVLYPGHADS